jgi:DNA repair exonuclease SbcCD ATPase subunit
LFPEDEKMIALAGKLRDLDSALRDVQAAIGTETEFVKVLTEELSSEASCPVGENDQTSGCVFIIRRNNKREELDRRKARITELSAKLPAIEAKIEAARDAKQMLKDNEKVRSTIQELSSRVKDKKSAINELTSKISVKEMSVSMLTDKLTLIDKNEEIVKQNRKVQEQIDETKRQISKLQDQREGLNEDITKTSNDLAVATARIEELEALIAEISSNDRKYELYNWYCKAMHRNGIPMTVLRKYIPVINYELNHILSPIVGFGVYFKIEDETEHIEIVMRYDNTSDDTRPITMASGMEKFISNMAIRHVLLKISALNKPTLRIIDEGFDVLDNDNVYLVQKFFENVKVDFDNIVLITHIDALKDCADHVVTVSQKAGVSRLRLN